MDSKTVVMVLSVVLFCSFLLVDDCLGQSRTWSSRDGKHKIEGAVERVDKEKGNVVLRLKDGTKRSVSISDLSKKDQTYIAFKFDVKVDKDLRTWTSSKGKKIRAKLLKFEDNKVYLQSPEGKNYAPIPLDRLSVADQDFVSPPRALQPTAAAKALKVSVDSTNSIGMQLKLIPAGKFTMGEGDDAHQVTLTQSFRIGVHEVTQEQYERVMSSNPSHFKGPQNPVEQVSWNDAVKFCEKLSALPEEKAAGRVYRLPTEAEWEYACRAGTTTKYSFGDIEGALGDYAWYRANSGGKTHRVGAKRRNPWGLYDMHGNVWEWCRDLDGDYPSGAVTDPTGAESGSTRVCRGGSWLDTAGNCRSAYRFGYSPSAQNPVTGFRVTCVPSGQ